MATSRHGVVGGNSVAEVDISLAYNTAGQVTLITRSLDGELAVTADYTFSSIPTISGLWKLSYWASYCVILYP